MEEKKVTKKLKAKVLGILGRRGSGKTCLLLDILKSQWKNKFDMVLIISPTLHLQKDMLDEIDGTGVILTTDLDPIIIETMLEFMQRSVNENKNVLLVLDDLSFQTRDKEKAELVDRLAFTSRHYRISVVLLAQKFTLLSPSFRSQLDHLYLFHMSNTREISMVYQEFCCADNFDDFRDMIRNLDDHEVLVLDNINGRIFTDNIK